MATSPGETDDGIITGVNVTPLVDVVLVLLVIMMVAATWVVARTIPLELPRAATGESTATVLAISIEQGGRLYLDGAPLDEPALRRAVRAQKTDAGLRAVIAADGRVPHARVVHVMDLLRQEHVTQFGIHVREPRP
jgi:biopolymer transport protein ExbD